MFHTVTAQTKSNHLHFGIDVLAYCLHDWQCARDYKKLR